MSVASERNVFGRGTKLHRNTYFVDHFTGTRAEDMAAKDAVGFCINDQFDKAITEGKRAIALGPNDALAHVLLAQTMRYAGRFEKAVELAEKAIMANMVDSIVFIDAGFNIFLVCEKVRDYRLEVRYEKNVENIIFFHPSFLIFNL